MTEKLIYKGTKKLPSFFNETDMVKILNQLLVSDDYFKSELGQWMRWRDVSLIATIYFLGLRPKEACCLKFSDFDLQHALIKISGKNNKTGKDRILPVPSNLIKFYKNYFSFPKHRFWHGSKYLFPSFQNPHISPERLKHIFREKVLKPLGLWEMPENSKVPRFRTYTLRHSRASHILKKQIKYNIPDLFAIANFLGHSDIRSTQVYLHTDSDYMEYLREIVNL